MPELGPYGSVRGARGNSRPYRERRRAIAGSRPCPETPQTGRSADDRGRWPTAAKLSNLAIIAQRKSNDPAVNLQGSSTDERTIADT